MKSGREETGGRVFVLIFKAINLLSFPLERAMHSEVQVLN